MPLTLIASHREVRIADAGEVIATHARSWGKAERIEDPAHIEGLVLAKRNAAPAAAAIGSPRSVQSATAS